MGINNSQVIKKPPKGTTDSFLEALRELGKDIQNSATEAGKGLIEEAKNQLTGKGEIYPNQPKTFQEEKEPFVSPIRPEFTLSQQEKVLWNQEKQQVQIQIKAILEELKRLAQATQNLTKEVQVAASQPPPVEPGKYHLSFFEKLRETLKLLRQRVENSVTWLQAFNQRKKIRNYYWAQVRKAGTKFMLSQERYMATQVG
ncbi:MAG: DUF5660 family protein [Microgenomates group bacterium]